MPRVISDFEINFSHAIMTILYGICCRYLKIFQNIISEIRNSYFYQQNCLCYYDKWYIIKIRVKMYFYNKILIKVRESGFKELRKQLIFYISSFK